MIGGRDIMKIKDVMTRGAVTIGAEESVEVAARTLTHYNIGILPVCDTKGTVCGLVTDRDLVIRCVAAGRNPETTAVRDVMTRHMIVARPERPNLNAKAFMKELAKKYTVYHGMGNHEYRSDLYREDYGEMYDEYSK